MLGRDLDINRKLNRSVSAQPYASFARQIGGTVILSTLSGPCQWLGESVDTPARRMVGCPVAIPFGVEIRTD